MAVEVNISDDNRPDDLDLLLQSPHGPSVIVLSEVGGSQPVQNVNLTIDDAAPGSLPNDGPLGTGSFKPTNHDGGDPDDFPSPAPAGPYVATLGELEGYPVDGFWQLFLVDDSDDGGNAGSLTPGIRIANRNRANVQLDPSPASGAEGSGSLPVEVNRVVAGGLGSVEYTVTPGSASAGVDFQPSTGTARFARGQTRTTVDVPLVADATDEPDEFFVFTVHGATGDAFIATSEQRQNITIADDDRPAVQIVRSARQRPLRPRAVFVVVRAVEGHRVTASGRITIPGASSVVLTRASTLTRAGRTRLKLKIPRRGLSALRAALEGRRRAVANLSVEVRDASGVTRKRVRIPLSR